ncbi:MAG: shikimate dehydrogenase [Verrucomicrobiales bacterium]|nr:shikimate dehydrogenase [Verrucomicrobiales bacterium]
MRFDKPIDGTTRFCAVIGHPIAHTASPAMQNAGIAALGLNWRYLALDVHPSDLRAAIEGARAMKFVGLNLTVPHKVLAMQMVDELDESARCWGAVNTIRFEAKDANGDWVPVHQAHAATASELRARGFNTDADAFIRAVREELQTEFTGARVLVVGVGGAGQVAALRLAAEGVTELFLVDAVPGRAEAVAAELRRRYPQVSVHVGFPRTSIELLVHATPLGWKPEDPLPFSETEFSLGRARAVYDMVYRPAETKLMRVAKAAGCRVANGLGMLLYQGARALELWSGLPAPVDVMRRALEQNVYGS